MDRMEASTGPGDAAPRAGLSSAAPSSAVAPPTDPVSPGPMARVVARLLVRLGAWISVAIFASFGGRAWWMLDLGSHFRLHYAVALGGVVALLFALRAHRAALLLSLPLLVDLAVVSPLFCECGAGLPGRPLGELRVVQFNLNAGNARIDDAARWLGGTDADVIVVHEVTPRSLPVLERAMTRFERRAAAARVDPFGVALFVRTPARAGVEVFAARVVDDLADGPANGSASVRTGSRDLGSVDVPCVEARVRFAGREARLLGLRAPPPVTSGYAAKRDQRIGALAAWVAAQHTPALVVGDFNATRWSAPVRSLRTATRLRDAERGRGFHPTWPVGSPIKIPIDLAFHTPELLVTAREIGPDLGSDHLPQSVRFAWREAP